MGALLAVMAAADVGFSNYQQVCVCMRTCTSRLAAHRLLCGTSVHTNTQQITQAEADRRATAALLRGGAALPPLPGDSGDMDTMPGMKAGAVDGMDRTGLQRRVQGLVAPRALGRGGHVVVSGPKGSGKSTLLRQVGRAGVRRVVCPSAHGEPACLRLLAMVQHTCVRACFLVSLWTGRGGAGAGSAVYRPPAGGGYRNLQWQQQRRCYRRNGRSEGAGPGRLPGVPTSPLPA